MDGGDGWQYHRGGYDNGFGWCDFVNGFNFDDGFNNGIIGGGHLRIVGTALDPAMIVCCRRGMWIVVVGIRPTGIGTDGGSGIGSRHTCIVPLRIVGTALAPATIVCCRRGVWVVVVGIRPTGIGTDGGSGIGSRHTCIVLIGDKPV